MITRARSLKKHTDAELVKLYLEGSQAAFTVLEARYHGWLISFALVMVGSRADAKDVVQNVWEKVQRRFNQGGYHEQDRFKKWLSTLVYHEAIDWLKKRRWHGMTRTVEKISADHSSVRSDIDTLRYPALAWAIKTLSLNAQTIIDLHFFKKMTFKEIAGILHLTIGAVTNAYSRALKKLRELMKPRFPPSQIFN
jgi:RNA polymerase sigma-70 factor (ECF subfamily)